MTPGAHVSLPAMCALAATRVQITCQFYGVTAAQLSQPTAGDAATLRSYASAVPRVTISGQWAEWRLAARLRNLEPCARLGRRTTITAATSAEHNHDQVVEALRQALPRCTVLDVRTTADEVSMTVEPCG